MTLLGGPRREGRGLRAGFREMRWGEAPRPGMALLEETGDDRFFTLPGENLDIAGAPLDRIIYKYWQNRLAEVQIEIPPASVDPVFRQVSSEWGKPDRPNRFIDDYNWQNDKQGIEGTSAFLSRNPNTRAAILLIQSRYILAKRSLNLPLPAPEKR
jgi:hypothetical protein